MFKITNFQFYCLLIILATPVASLELPHRLVHVAYNNAWLAVLAAILPGALLVLMYSSIIRKSGQPFPRLLDEHFGKLIGKILGFAYIFIFFLTGAYSLRLFIEFMKMNVLPATPISIFIGCILLAGFLAIKMGMQQIARACEIIVVIGLLFTFLIVSIALFSNFQPERILPLAYMDYKGFIQGVATTSIIFGKIMPVLTLAFFLPQRDQAPSIMYKVLLTYIIALTFICVGLVITIGTMPSLNSVFPTFNMIRLARIGAFVQNVDIVFISVFINGIFAAVTIPWFMACFTIKEIFNLQEYRFLAAPSSLIMGILSIIISGNSLEVVYWSLRIIPIVYGIAFIIVPFIIFLVTLFKPYPDMHLSNQPHSDNPLHKQMAAGKN